MSLYSDVDLIHEPDAHPKWQESFVLIFRDPATDLVGFLRLGAYVNEGTCQTHFGLATGDGLRFRRHRLAMPASDGERTRESVRAGPLSWAIPRGACVHVRGEEKEASVDLRLYDFFPSQNWRIADPKGVEIAKHVGGFNHPESSGRVEGRVRIGERVIDIENGLGHRDHAWGPRDHHAILNNRWIAGTVGPELVLLHDVAAGQRRLLQGGLGRARRQDGIRPRREHGGYRARRRHFDHRRLDGDHARLGREDCRRGRCNRRHHHLQSRTERRTGFDAAGVEAMSRVRAAGREGSATSTSTSIR